MSEESNRSKSIVARKVNPFRPEFPILSDYGNIRIGGYSLNLWLSRQEINLLQAGNSLRYRRSVVFWHMIHISLSFYHIRGQSFSEEEFVLLQKLLDHFIPGLTASLTTQFVYLLYCYVVGVYGCFDSSITFVANIRSCIELELSNEEYAIGLDPDEIDVYRNPLPFPAQ